MVSTVQTRPNHYQVLGLSPTATAEEIESAFAGEMSAYRPRAFGDVAAVSIAYKTLRDPAKRRAYDEAIGVRPKVKAPPPAITATAGRASAIMASTGATSTERLAEYLIAPPSSAAEPEAVPAPEPEAQPRREAAPVAGPRIEEVLALHRSSPDHATDEDGRAEWTRPALTIGSLFLGAALVGVLAGWRTVGSIEQPQPAHAATVGRAVPRADAVRTAPAEAPGIPRQPRAARPEQPRTADAARARHAPAPKLEAPVAADEITEDIMVVNGSSGAAHEVAAASTDQSASAALPLSNATIARTIGRIGYSCGKVTATDAVDGASGVFKITCASGQSYRAAPVRGRYHFRRWSD